MNHAATNAYSAPAERAERRSLPLRLRWLLALGAAGVLAILAWQGVTAGGNPDPTLPHTRPTAAVFDIAVLVFREGLECALVLSAITAGLTGPVQEHRRPIAAGVGIGFAATLVTWFIAAGILSQLASSIPALSLQAGTGLLAVIVLLIVMNWFFHKLYWGGWISLHNSRKRELMAEDSRGEITPRRLWWGLALLGFSSLYREGFEVVLFLQTYFLQLGGRIVLLGALIGLALTAVVAVLNFVAHRRLPYRRMLVLTGVLLGIVLLVMVGEQAQEMQLAHWIPTTPIHALTSVIPDWMGLWFSIFPTVQTLFAQILAAVFVIGCFFLAKRRSRPRLSGDFSEP